MDRATRKELKTDHFVERVQIWLYGLAQHRDEVKKYGAIAAVVLVLVVAGVLFFRWKAEQRRIAFGEVLLTLEAPVAPAGQVPGKSFETEEAKEKAVADAIAEFSKEHGGSNEDAVGHYYLASFAVEDGNLEKALSEVEIAIQNGDSDTAGIARFLKANILRAQGKTDEAETILRELMNAPSGFVTKDDVTVALAKTIAKKNPDEAIKLLEPMRLAEGSTQRIASKTIEEIRSKQAN